MKLVRARTSVGVALWAAAVWPACARAAVGRPDSPARRISPSPTAAPIDLELHDADIYDALRTLAMNARLSLFLDPDLTGRVTLDVRGRPWDSVLEDIAKSNDLRIEQLDVPSSEHACFWVTKLSRPPAPERHFAGTPIEVRLDDTPIRDAAQTLSKAAHVRISVDDDVQASVTLHLREIPWDLALYHLAQKYVLRIIRTGTGFRISRANQ